MDGLTADIREKMPVVLHALLMMPMTVISVSPAGSRKWLAFGLKKCATNHVGMEHCAETR